MRKILDETSPDGQSERERIFRHQVEVAQSWEVRIVGRDGNGELLKVASGRDSTAAAEFVFGLVGLKPDDVAKTQLAMAEHFRQVERDRLEIALKMLGERINQWPPERARDFLASCSRDPRGFLLAAEEYVNRQEDRTVSASGGTERASPTMVGGNACQPTGIDTPANDQGQPASLVGDSGEVDRLAPSPSCRNEEGE